MHEPLVLRDSEECEVTPQFQLSPVLAHVIVGELAAIVSLKIRGVF
jgi:hypothetical protein